jgi:hypothetical protein
VASVSLISFNKRGERCSWVTLHCIHYHQLSIQYSSSTHPIDGDSLLSAALLKYSWLSSCLPSMLHFTW